MPEISEFQLATRFGMGSAAHQRLLPQYLFIFLRDHDIGFLSGDVSRLHHDLFQTADVIRVGVGDEVVGYIRDPDTQFVQRLRALVTTIDQNVISSLYNEDIILVENLRERRSGTQEEEGQVAPVGETEFFGSMLPFLHSSFPALLPIGTGLIAATVQHPCTPYIIHAVPEVVGPGVGQNIPFALIYGIVSQEARLFKLFIDTESKDLTPQPKV